MNNSGTSPLAGLTDENYDETMGIFIGDTKKDVIDVPCTPVEVEPEAEEVGKNTEKVASVVADVLDKNELLGIPRIEQLKLLITNATDLKTYLEIVDELERSLNEAERGFVIQEHGEIITALNSLDFISGHGHTEIYIRIANILLTYVGGKKGTSYDLVKPYLFRAIEKIGVDNYMKLLDSLECHEIDIAVKMLDVIKNLGTPDEKAEFQRYLFEKFSTPQMKDSSSTVFHQVVTVQVPKYSRDEIEKIYIKLAEDAHDIEILTTITDYCIAQKEINYGIFNKLIFNSNTPTELIHKMIPELPNSFLPSIIGHTRNTAETVDLILTDLDRRKEFSPTVCIGILDALEKRRGSVPLTLIAKLSSSITSRKNFLEYPELERRLKTLLNYQRAGLDGVEGEFDEQKQEQIGGKIKRMIYNWRNRKELKARKTDGF